MKYFLLFLGTLLIVLGANCQQEMKNSSKVNNNPILNDSLLAIIDFYYLNRGCSIQSSCNSTKEFISTDIIVKKMRERIYICILPDDSCAHKINKIHNTFIDVLKYDSTGSVMAVYSGPVLFDNPKSFFTKDYRKVFIDSLFNNIDILSPTLKNIILSEKSN